jgi:hypothetical protein
MLRRNGPPSPRRGAGPDHAPGAPPRGPVSADTGDDAGINDDGTASRLIWHRLRYSPFAAGAICEAVRGDSTVFDRDPLGISRNRSISTEFPATMGR